MNIVRIFNATEPVNGVISSGSQLVACTGFIVKCRGVRFVVSVAHGEIPAAESLMALRCQGQDMVTKIGKARYVDVKRDLAVFPISDRYYTAPAKLADRHDYAMEQTLSMEGYSVEKTRNLLG
jgi:hypothetical protein